MPIMIAKIIMINENCDDYDNAHLIVNRHCIEGWYWVPERHTPKAWPENKLIIHGAFYTGPSQKVLSEDSKIPTKKR